jgi:SAM-dependent methyltransferase
LRDLALRVASPLDTALRRLAGAPAMPPLWLRRHAGPIRRFPRAAADAVAALRDRGLLAPGMRLLDLGCGPGGLPLALQPHLPPDARYLGLDVHAASIAWCRSRFRDDARFRFERVAAASPYGVPDDPPASSLRLPLEDASQDLVVARSLFTHLLEEESAHYLAEISRVLAPEGHALVTAFLFERGREVPFLPWALEGGAARVRRRDWPTAAVGYEREAFLGMVAAARLTPVETWEGFYPGSARRPGGQDVLFLRPERGESRRPAPS